MKTNMYLTFCFVLAGIVSHGAVQDSTKLQPAYLIIESDTVFTIFGKVGAYTPAERVAIINQRLDRLIRDDSFEVDSLYVDNGESTSDILYMDQVVLSVTDDDARPLTKTRQTVSKEVLQRLQQVLGEGQRSRSIVGILIRIGLTILELSIIFLLIRYLNKLFNFTRKWLITTREKILTGIRFRGYELLDTNRELQVALFINSILRWTVIVIVLYLAIPILFSIFPWTRGLSDKLFSYILAPVRNLFFAVINYIPNLFSILVIYFAIRYTIRFFKFLAEEIEKGALTISGFYPDWAMPTFNIIRVLLYAFMFIAIFKYLPGSDSPVFQGVSVFLGILLSLGSSSAISNAVAGLVITYMRPFKVGDRIKIGEIVGDVIDKTILVTRVRSIKNEDITIPNSTVLSSHTVNYTSSAKELGLILYTSVTIGYDVPWKQVHELLLNAALDTDGILKEEERKPFVLQTSLDDFYVSYQINAYTAEPHRTSVIFSELHQRIQDQFNAAGVEIMSPHYRAERDGNKSTIPGVRQTAP